MSSQQIQQKPNFDSGSDSGSDSKSKLCESFLNGAFGAIGGTGTVGTFGVVRGKLRGLLGLLLVVFCCLFEEERVIAGIERCWNDVELEDFEYKEKKINF